MQNHQPLLNHIMQEELYRKKGKSIQELRQIPLKRCEENIRLAVYLSFQEYKSSIHGSITKT